MSGKTDTLRVSMEPELKKSVEAIFARLGMSAGEAVNLFYRQVKAQKRIPFSVNVPNAETAKALKQVKARKGLKTYKNTGELFDTFR